MTKELTDRQRQVLDAIRRYIAERGFPPSIRELGQMVGVRSLRGVTIHLDALERKGWIERERTSRGIRLSRQAEAIAVSLLETDAKPRQLDSLLIGHECIYVPANLATSNNDFFAFRVRGNSMSNDYIADGDYLVVQRTKEVDEGSLVAVQVGGETLVKRLSNSAATEGTRSKRSEHSWATSTTNEERILGKVVWLFRRIS